MNFCVVGAGAWGTAFAVHLARMHRPTVLVPRRREQVEALTRDRENKLHLPGIELPRELRIVPDAQGAAVADVVLIACPAQEMRPTAQRVAMNFCAPADGGPFVISLAKGLESGTHLRPSQIIEDLIPSALVGALSGPTNAGEVAHGLPAAMVLAAAADPRVAEVQALLSGPTLRIYTTDDLAGVEYGGCLKNIYAIAAGCSDGLKLGDNTKAALLTRALAEMVRVGASLGARAETFYGLSGFGDLVATCHGEWSRNRQFGLSVASGRSPAALLSERSGVVEGYKTTESFAELCRERSIEAPILQEMHAILFQGKQPAAALTALMTRGLKREAQPL